MSAPDGRLDTVTGDVPGVAWPPLFSTRYASLAALLRQLDSSQWLSPDDIAAGQRRQLAALAAHFERTSPQFAGRLRGAGLSVTDLCDDPARLPALTRRDLQADPGWIADTALPAGHGPTKSVKTSGSTGEPVKVLKTAVTQLFWAAMTLRYHLWHEPDFSGRMAASRSLMPQPGAYPDWGPPFTHFFATGPSLRLDNGTDLGDQIAALRAFDPDTLIIYPTHLGALLDRMEAEGFALPGLARIRTIAETLPPAVRARAETMTGAAVRDCYSSEEFGYIAIECPAGGLLHAMSETVMVEVVDGDGRPCGAGETGALVVTDLQNQATPLIRYAIGDHAEVGPPCACGRGLPTLARILGRTRNMIRLPDGSTHWPLTGNKVMRDVAPIRQFQYVQHSLDEIEMRLVTDRPLTAEEEEALTRMIRTNYGHPFAIRFTYFDDAIPRGRNGKFEEFVCAID